jgi:hypothetical protein
VSSLRPRSAWVAALVVAAGACGVGAPAARAATTHRAKVDFSQLYLAIVGPANQAGNVLQRNLDAKPAATGKALSEDVARYVKVDKAAMNKLAEVHWPGPTETDMRRLIGAESVLSRDLTAQNGPAVSADASRAQADVILVRADLGLSPKK